MLGGRQFQQLAQIEIQLALDQDIEHADGGPAQGERVLGARGALADAEDAGQRVQTIRQRDRQPGGCPGNLVAGEAGQILLMDGFGHGFRLTVVARVVSAHDPLQFGEFEHHLGDQVALCQLCRARGCLGIPVDLAGNEAGDDFGTSGLVGKRTELVLEDDIGQRLAATLQRPLAIGLEEEGCIGQARTNDLFVAVDDLLRVFAIDVGQRDELRLELAVGIEQMEVFLVGLHRGDQALRRYFEEALVEAAGQRYRPLDQSVDFFQQVFVDDRLGVVHFRLGQNLFADTFATALEIHQHVGIFERGFVVVRMGELDRSGGVKTVAPGRSAGFQIQHAGRDDLVAIEQDQPVYRTGEFRA